MGGADSEVCGTTQRIVFEAAWFNAGVDTRDQQGARSQDRSVDAFRARHGSHGAAARHDARAASYSRQIGAGKPDRSIH